MHSKISLIWLVVSFLVLFFSLGCSDSAQIQTEAAEEKPAAASNKSVGKAADKPLSRLVEDYAPVVKVLALDKQHADAINAVHQEFERRLNDWHATDGKEMRLLQKQALDAARSRDRAAMRRLNASGGKEKVAEYHEVEQSIQKQYESDLLDAIPAEKLIQWKAYRIATCLLMFLEPLNLEQKQVEQVHGLAPDAIRSLRNESNWQGLGTDKLEKLFERKVLVPKQEEIFEDLKSGNKLRMLKWNN